MSSSIDIPEAITAIKEMANMLDPDDDYLVLAAAKDAMHKAQQARKKEVEDAHNTLKALSKILESARVSASRPRTVPSADDHAATLNTFYTSRISLAKSISDMEALAVNKSDELAALKERVRQSEAYDPAAQHNQELDGTPLRLKLFKGLGFQCRKGPDGSVSKIIVGAVSGDLHTIDINPNEVDLNVDLNRKLWSAAMS